MRIGRLRETLPLAASLLLALLVCLTVASYLGRPPAADTTMQVVPPSDTGAPPPAGMFGAWRLATLPPALTYGRLTPLAVATADGATAYACVPPLDATGTPKPTVAGDLVQVWVTRDAAQSWRRVADLDTEPAILDDCQIQVDALDPAVVLARTRTSGYYTTADYGASWKLLGLNPATAADGGVTLLDPASARGVTYALRCCADGARLVAGSGDASRWGAVDGPIVSAGQRVTGFWLDPTTDALLAVASVPESPAGGHLWLSPDGGRSWSALRGPALAGYVAQPGGARPWHICGMTYAAAGPAGATSATTRIACSLDGGRTWQDRPLIGLGGFAPATDADRASPDRRATLVALAPNGDLLLDDALTADHILYRLPAGGVRWLPVGAVPGGATTLVAGTRPDGLTLWTLPQPGSVQPPGDPSGRIYTLAYPG